MDDTKASLLLSRRLPSSNSDLHQYIQQKLRSNKHFEKLKSEFKSASNKGKISVIDWIRIINDNDINLDDHENAYCIKRFALNDEINYIKFFEALDLLPPSPFEEPELFADTLPYPYSMIHEIFELEILDKAWFEITRIHKDILLDSNGQQLHKPRNFALQHHCTPETIIENNHNSPLPGITSLQSCDNTFALATITSGDLLLLDPTSNTTLASISMSSPKSSPNNLEIQTPGTTASAAGTVLSELWIPHSPMTIIMGKYSLSRVSVCSIIEGAYEDPQLNANNIDSSNPKTKKTAPPAAPLAPTTAVTGVNNPLAMKLRIVIIDICRDRTSTTDGFLVAGRNIYMKKITEFTHKLPAPISSAASTTIDDEVLSKVDRILEIKESVCAYFNPTADVLLISIPYAIFLYSLPPTVDLSLLSAQYQPESIPENTETSDSNTSTINTIIPVLTIDEKNLPSLSNISIWKSFCSKKQYGTELTLQLLPSTVTTPADTAAVTVANRLNNLTIAVMANNELFVIGISVTPPPPPPAPPVVSQPTVPPSKLGAAAAKQQQQAAVGTPSTTSSNSAKPPPLVFTFQPIVLAQWNLGGSNLTCCTVDTEVSHNTVAVLGFQDGSILLWNIASRTFISTVGKHEAAITALTIIPGVNNDDANDRKFGYLITGGNDGTLCFFKLEYPVAFHQHDSFHTTLLIDFRTDVLGVGCSVSNICSISNSNLVFVYYSESDVLACYDCSNATLIGSYVLYSGINARQITSRFLYQGDIEMTGGDFVRDEDAKISSHALVRRSKYEIDTSFTGKTKIFSKSIISCFVKDTLMIMFCKDKSTRVFTSIHINKLISCYCPGVAAVVDRLYGEHKTLNAAFLYSYLSPEQRMNHSEALFLINSFLANNSNSKSVAQSNFGIPGILVGGLASRPRTPNSGTLQRVTSSTKSVAVNEREISRTTSMRSDLISKSAIKESSGLGFGKSSSILTEEALELHQQFFEKSSLLEFISKVSFPESDVKSNEDGKITSKAKKIGVTTKDVEMLSTALDSMQLARQSALKSKMARQERAKSVKKNMADMAKLAGRNMAASFSRTSL